MTHDMMSPANLETAQVGQPGPSLALEDANHTSVNDKVEKNLRRKQVIE